MTQHDTAHDHAHGHDHAHDHGHDHGHSHGLVDPSIKRSRAGLRAVGISLGVLGATALAQVAIFAFSNSVALLADLIHNVGDALTPSRSESPSCSEASARNGTPASSSCSRS